jgi:RNA polymerase sigma-70 factor (ECF subfamily)
MAHDSQQLLAAAVAGDQAALERLLFESYDLLHAHVASRISPQYRGLIDPEDILQQTLFEAFRDVGRFRPESPEAFTRWLKAIAEHRLLDAIKSLRRKKRGGDARKVEAASDGQNSAVNLLAELAADGPTPSRVVAQEEAIALLQVNLARLPEQYAAALRLRYLQGLSEEEAAAQLNQTPDAIRGLCHRGKKKLREAMGQSSLYDFGR